VSAAAFEILYHSLEKNASSICFVKKET
jgi:hypothetical protein